tara:strand:- start:2060 stop:2209 length:150 start_codon:yes stop_codon:yes gene_type:complete
MEVIGSMSSEDKNLVWAKDDKGNDVVTLETAPKKDGDKPEKLKSMTYKG